MSKKKSSVMIDEEVWIKMKLKCVKNKIDISDYLEELIKKDLKKDGKN